MIILVSYTIVILIDHCLSGFPRAVDLDIHGSGRGERRVITRLFPGMKFGCFGTIVGVTVAIWDSNRSQRPKLQIWRENGTQSGLYHKITPSDIEIRNSNHQCYQRNNVNSGIFQCTLKEDLHISVQSGDFLGLEIPSIDDDDLEISFKAGGPTNLVFQGQLGSTQSVDLSTKPHATTNDEPQITFLVVLGTFLAYNVRTEYKLFIMSLQMKVEIHVLQLIYQPLLDYQQHLQQKLTLVLHLIQQFLLSPKSPQVRGRQPVLVIQL